MRIVALIERILRHLGLWEVGVRVDAARDPPEPDEAVIPPLPAGYGGQAEPWLEDPFPDNPGSGKVRPGGSHFRPTCPPRPPFLDAGRAPHPERAGA